MAVSLGNNICNRYDSVRFDRTDIVLFKINRRIRERREIASLFFCLETYNFSLKLYTKIFRKYIIGGLDMGLCQVKILIFNE